MTASKLLPSTGRRLPPNAGKGRPKGATNKIQAEVRSMIEGALAEAGGQQYLARQARENPVAFMSLLGKLIPRDIKVEAPVDMKAAATLAVAEMMAKLFKPPGDAGAN